LLVGTIIYLLFYPSSIFLNQYIQPVFENLFGIDLPIESGCKYIFNIPTAIWSFCFIFAILLISYDIDWILFLAISLIIIPELMQHNKLGYIGGTFDINDLIMNSFGILAAIYFARKIHNL
tara:strand:+ start:669 stop:1031 length:363 start_codon:yes stop_codon:yes gene_type:complete